MMAELLLILRPILSLKTLESFKKSCIFYLHQMNSIGKLFTDIPRIGLKNGKSLKNHLVRSVLPKIDVAGNSSPCGGKRHPCELCKLMKKTSTL